LASSIICDPSDLGLANLAPETLSRSPVKPSMAGTQGTRAGAKEFRLSLVLAAGVDRYFGEDLAKPKPR
jgi:hypothetical protein